MLHARACRLGSCINRRRKLQPSVKPPRIWKVLTFMGSYMIMISMTEYHHLTNHQTIVVNEYMINPVTCLFSCTYFEAIYVECLEVLFSGLNFYTLSKILLACKVINIMIFCGNACIARQCLKVILASLIKTIFGKVFRLFMCHE